MRVSAYIAAKYKLSRRYAKLAIRQGRVSIGGVAVAADEEVEAAYDYELSMPALSLEYKFTDYLVKEAGELLFLYKPPLMHTERLRPEDALCMSDILAESFPEYRLISRLDYGVDGLVPALKKGLEISKQHKVYLAWVAGNFPQKAEHSWQVDADGRKRVKAYQSDDGVAMLFELLEQAEGKSLVRISLELAHRHQVRAVCAHMGHPILGDSLYGDAAEQGRILLHCASVNINGSACKSPYIAHFSSL